MAPVLTALLYCFADHDLACRPPPPPPPIPSIKGVNLDSLLGMDTGVPVAATVDRVLAQEDQRRQLNSADIAVPRLSFTWALGRNRVPRDFQAPSTANCQSAGLPLYCVRTQQACSISRNDNGLKPTAGPLGTPCTAPFQFAASTKVHAIGLRSPRRFGYLIFQCSGWESSALAGGRSLI